MHLHCRELGIVTRDGGTMPAHFRHSTNKAATLK